MRGDASIDMVFRLRPLGRLWLYVRAFVDLVWTKTITITIEFQGPRPVVTHDGEVIEPNLNYELEDKEIDELVKRVPLAKLQTLTRLVHARYDAAAAKVTPK